jgi:transposase-like protein
MKELFEKTREFILHLDGSAEAGDEIIFTAKEGITEITIDSWIMPSESRHYIKPFLQHIKDTYEMPLVVIREMSKEISSAVSEIFPGISHQICHSHFIRNLSDQAVPKVQKMKIFDLSS